MFMGWSPSQWRRAGRFYTRSFGFNAWLAAPPEEVKRYFDENCKPEDKYYSWQRPKKLDNLEKAMEGVKYD